MTYLLFFIIIIIYLKKLSSLNKFIKQLGSVCEQIEKILLKMDIELYLLLTTIN